jgi:hypothetical protein
MDRSILSILFFLIALQTHSQKRFLEAEILVTSRHVWRGTMLGTAPAIEPSVTLSGSRFSLNIWASMTTNNSYSEVDLVPSYRFNEFSLTLFDYYNPVPDEENAYFNFQKGESRHSLELTVDNYSIDKRRLKWMIGTFLLGDRNDETGYPYFSTYLEIRYPFTIWMIKTEPFVGMTPFSGYYANEPAIINLGVKLSKEIELKMPFSVPISLSLLTNPYAKQSFVIFATGIAF